MNGIKNWYESKVVWVNAITTLIAVMSLFADQEMLSGDAKAYVLLAVGVLNVVLRVWFTDTVIG